MSRFLNFTAEADVCSSPQRAKPSVQEDESSIFSRPLFTPGCPNSTPPKSSVAGGSPQYSAKFSGVERSHRRLFREDQMSQEEALMRSSDIRGGSGFTLKGRVPQHALSTAHPYQSEIDSITFEQFRSQVTSYCH